MAHFPKPAEGSWTEHYPGLGTSPVNYEDSISPEHYELERKAIFARTWLNVGRVEQVPRTGSYFTKELQCAGTSVIIVRDKEGGVRGFHNMCRHRGNKLVWNDFPARRPAGPAGSSPASTTAGATTSTARSPSSSRSRSSSISTRTTTGLFPCRPRCGRGSSSSTSTRTTPRRSSEYLGDLGAGLEGYPFGEMTQVYKYRAEVGSNGSSSSMPSPSSTTHLCCTRSSDRRGVAQAPGSATRRCPTGSTAPRHGVVVGRHGPAQGPEMVKPIERVLRSGLFGPWDRPDIDGLDQLPGGSTRHARRPGVSTPSCSSPTSCCWSGPRVGT